MDERPRLSGMCAGCKRADWANNECYAVADPESEWDGGKCKKRLMPTRAETAAVIEGFQCQYQEARGSRPDIHDDPIGYLMATHPPNRKEKPIHCPLPALPCFGGGSKSGRKRKGQPKKVWVDPWS